MDTEDIEEAACRLRLDGKSSRQIAEQLGVSQRVVERMVAGQPVPGWTRRPRAKDELRARARELRTLGRTYTEIAAELGVSKSSCSLWLRDMAPPEHREHRPPYSEERVRAMWRKRWEPVLRERAAERAERTYTAARQIGRLTDRELLIAGAILYWAEGCKSKPWRRSEEVAFINSDPSLIRFFLAWLTTLGVSVDRLVLRVSIHVSADVQAAVEYWSVVTGVPASRFAKTTLKRHNPKTVRKNVGDDYHGCLVVRVRRSAELYRDIDGWVRGAVAGAVARSTTPTVADWRMSRLPRSAVG